MSIDVTHLSVVSEFLDIDFDPQSIGEEIKMLVNRALVKYNISMPSDWILVYDASYNNGVRPLVSRNKLGNFKSDKMKCITIVIPIPLLSEISWGVRPDQHLYPKNHFENLMKNFFELDIDFRVYNNRTDYILACLKAGIVRSFQEGFTVGAMKIKKNVCL